MLLRRLIATFASDADYWRLILFIFLVALIVGSAFLILAPHEIIPVNGAIIIPLQSKIVVDYGPAAPHIVYPAAGSHLIKDIYLDDNEN
jgi:hypothetical protein